MRDYRHLNDIKVPNRYPLPRTKNFHNILKGRNIISRFDLLKAYYQTPIAED